MAVPCPITTAAPPTFGVLPSSAKPIQQPHHWHSGPLKCDKQAHVIGWFDVVLVSLACGAWSAWAKLKAGDGGVSRLQGLPAGRRRLRFLVRPSAFYSCACNQKGCFPRNMKRQGLPGVVAGGRTHRVPFKARSNQ
jgi:hypothetical protein